MQTVQITAPVRLGQTRLPDLRKLVESVAADPAEAERFFAGMTEAMLWEMEIGMSGEGDRAVYTAPSCGRMPGRFSED